MNEIHRLLKPEGVCFFSAGNRIQLIEPHYRLPLLSVLPRWMSHLYLRLARRGRFYYEQYPTLWGLRDLTRDFEVVDYTKRVVREPERFQATELLRSGSARQRLALLILELAYWLCPTYLWLLRKRPRGRRGMLSGGHR